MFFITQQNYKRLIISTPALNRTLNWSRICCCYLFLGVLPIIVATLIKASVSWSVSWTQNPTSALVLRQRLMLHQGTRSHCEQVVGLFTWPNYTNPMEHCAFEKAHATRGAGDNGDLRFPDSNSDSTLTGINGNNKWRQYWARGGRYYLQERALCQSMFTALVTVTVSVWATQITARFMETWSR